ncbi:hypothetical protein ACSXA0_15495 (plasmid) [Clostridium perfringens]
MDKQILRKRVIKLIHHMHKHYTQKEIKDITGVSIDAIREINTFFGTKRGKTKTIKILSNYNNVKKIDDYYLEEVYKKIPLAIKTKYE